MENPRAARIVIGYHDVSPDSPAEARDLGLNSRVAVILESYRPDSFDMVFDHHLWTAAVRSVSACLSATRVEGIREPPATSWLRRLLRPSPEQVVPLETLLQELNADSDPPYKVRWYRGAELVAAACSELWCRAGGPMPYHDSYTLSCFVADHDSENLARRLVAAISQAGGSVTEVIRAGSRAA